MDMDLKLDGFSVKDSSRFLDQDRDFFYTEEYGVGDISVIWGNYNKCNRDYKISRDDYPYFVLEYVIGGKGGFKCEEQEWDLLPGMVFCFSPHVAHSYWSSCDSPMEKMSVIFSCSEASMLNVPLVNIRNSAFFVDEKEKIFDLFSRILEEGLNKGNFSRDIINHLIAALIFQIDRNRKESSEFNQAYASFARCKRYIESNGSRKTQVSDIARECNIDGSYMNRLFRKHMNCSPSHYLSRILIEKSMDLLKQNEIPIKDIALELGFANPYHFSSYFKKHVLVSPSEFRKIRSGSSCGD